LDNQNLNAKSFEELFAQFIQFSETTFIGAEAESYLNKLKEETKELTESPNMEELADCMLVLIGLSRFLPGDLKTALTDKINKNINRTWELQKDGTYHHVNKNI